MARQVELIVEDGTIVAGANSFVSETDLVSFALARGVVLPFTSDPEKDAVAVLGIKGADYLKIMPWRGELVDPNQPMPFPRKNMDMSPPFPENAVPVAVVEAQKQLALLVKSGVEIMPTWSGAGFTIKEKVGPIEEMYSEKVGVSKDGLPILPGITGLLAPWLIGDMDGAIPVMIRSVGEKLYGDC